MPQKPRPHVRPSVTLGGTHEQARREWRHIEPMHLQRDDIVSDKGRVVSVEVDSWTVVDPWKKVVDVTVIFLSGASETYRGSLHPVFSAARMGETRYEGPTVFAFTAAQVTDG